MAWNQNFVRSEIDVITRDYGDTVRLQVSGNVLRENIVNITEIYRRERKNIP